MKCKLSSGFEFDITNIIETNDTNIGKSLRMVSLDRAITLSKLEKEVTQASTNEIVVTNTDAGIVTTYYGYTTVSSISFKNNKYEVGYDIQLTRPINYSGKTDALIEGDIITT